MDKIRSSKKSPSFKRQKQATLAQIFEPSSTEESTSAKGKKTMSTTQQTLIQMIAVTSESQKEGMLVGGNPVLYPKFLMSFEAMKLLDFWLCPTGGSDYGDGRSDQTSGIYEERVD